MATHISPTGQAGRSDPRHQTLLLPDSATFRWTTIVLTGLIGLTAVAGGVAIASGFENESLIPTPSVLAGSVFTSFVIPGLLLAVVVGGLQLLAAVLAIVRSRWTILAVTVAAIALLVWIFVETAMIPWSMLQAVYFAAGLVEIGLVMVGLGLLSSGTRR
ncbi:hypothetical protein [Curtobacterium sp. PhB115]|uniref:hypothetical protein n=1 Tax=Curtobacterium sp. PhB115 TaxID=2485173 RepID=UPI000FB62818|nr:hypothetical protein [Curtobacterium sp. PhB115]ROP58682.1 hypothetical protein EDF19_3715 [Curtobacterium sp. PhB115]